MIVGVTRRGSSPIFIGREADLERLDQAYERAVLGQPSLMLVAGEAGVGKSRLVAEFGGRVESSGGWAIAGGCLDLGVGGLPYAPFAEALRQIAVRIPPDELERVIGPGADALRWLVPDLLGRSALFDPTAPSDPAGRLARLFDAVLALLGMLADARPLVVALEDIHWADGSTRDLIRFLVRNLRNERLLMVATYRSDDLHRRHPSMPLLSELERAERVERLELRRFDRRELTAHLAAILGVQPDERMVNQLLERSDGIPFYVEELLAEGDATTRLPTTLHDILEQRLTALSPESLGLVRAASIIGTRFSHDRLVAVVDLDRDGLADAMHEAIDERIVVTIDGVGGPAYAFRHALLREAAYDDLLPAERVRLHGRLADHLEGLLRATTDGEDPGAMADLAIHAYHAHDQPRALVSAVQAVRALEHSAAFREALGHAERAIELWPRVEDAEAKTGVAYVDLLEKAAIIAANAGDSRRAIALHEHAIAELGSGAGPERLAGVLVALWEVAWESNELVLARKTVERALEIVEDRPPSHEKAMVLITAGSDRWTAGSNLASVAAYEASMAVAEAIGDDRAWGVAAGPLAHGLALIGRPGRAEALADRVGDMPVVAEIHPIESWAWPFWIHIDLAIAYWFAGRFERSIQISLVALDAATRYGVADRFRTLLTPTDALFELGRIDEVEDLLDRIAGGGRSSDRSLQRLEIDAGEMLPDPWSRSRRLENVWKRACRRPVSMTHGGPRPTAWSLEPNANSTRRNR